MKDNVRPMIFSLSRSILLVLVIFAAIVETCTAWTVFSIFLGQSASVFLSFAVFHFAASDSILVFESLARQSGLFLSLSLEVSTSMFAFWLILYGLVAYTAFYVFLPFSFMQNSFRLSLFMYAYFSKYYQIIPLVVHWLVMPSSLVVTLNAFNKVCACLHDLASFFREGKSHSSFFPQRIIEYFWTAITYLICFTLTLSFSESVYLSMHYGVSHYLIMSATTFSLSFVQEFLLLTLISLSTFKTMFSVSSAIVTGLKNPYNLYGVFRKKTGITFREISINLWGFFTLFVRAFVRGVQTTTLGQGFKQVVVHVVDKGRNNAPAKIFMRQKIPSCKNAKGKEQEKSENRDKHVYDWRKEMVNTLSSIRVV